MLVYVVGAPGSGKTAVVPHLRQRLDEWVVFDWDALLGGATALAAVDVRRSPEHWARYDELVLASVAEVRRSGLSCVVLGVRTPAELAHWPVDRWILLDCDDEERGRRLVEAGRPDDRDGAISDAARDRAQGLQAIDTSAMPPEAVAEELASLIGRAESAFREI